MSLEQFERLKTGSVPPSRFPDNLDIKPSAQTSSSICQEGQIRSPLLSIYAHITFQHKVTLQNLAFALGLSAAENMFVNKQATDPKGKSQNYL